MIAGRSSSNASRLSADVRQHLFPNRGPDGKRDPRGMIIRDALEEDLPAIIEIYNAAIRGRVSTAQLDEVSVEQRLPWFYQHSPGSHPLWVAEMEGAIAG